MATNAIISEAQKADCSGSLIQTNFYPKNKNKRLGARPIVEPTKPRWLNPKSFSSLQPSEHET